MEILLILSGVGWEKQKKIDICTSSQGGKITLLKSLLDSLNLYSLSTLNPPKGNLELIFLWDIKWDENISLEFLKNLWFSKDEGSIGIKSMKDVSTICVVN